MVRITPKYAGMSTPEGACEAVETLSPGQAEPMDEFVMVGASSGEMFSPNPRECFISIALLFFAVTLQKGLYVDVSWHSLEAARGGDEASQELKKDF